MKRNAWNILVDTISLAVFMTMISTGLILNFVLPPGSGRGDVLFDGGGHKSLGKTIDLFMGLTRHEWGQIHFYISIVFLILLITHLYLHWNWIKGVVFGPVDHPQSLKRKVIVLCVLAFIVVSLIFPWIGHKQTYTKSEFMKLRNKE